MDPLGPASYQASCPPLLTQSPSSAGTAAGTPYPRMPRKGFACRQ